MRRHPTTLRHPIEEPPTQLRAPALFSVRVSSPCQIGQRGLSSSNASMSHFRRQAVVAGERHFP
jgi:hypothetical protein